jgi:hypothetical protein
MAEFIVNQDVTTDTATVEVTISANNPLALGRHRFRLVVTDDAGNVSAPDEVELIVADQDAPTAVLDVPRITPFGRSFELGGTRSFDAGGGRIVRYAWTYLGPSV